MVLQLSLVLDSGATSGDDRASARTGAASSRARARARPQHDLALELDLISRGARGSELEVARASGEPGRTRELNFFNVDDTNLRIVDLPGYGYAKAPKDVVEKWTKLTRNFLRGRVNLKRVYLLIDSRHGLKPVDEKIMDVFDEAAVSYQIVLTKTDKIKPPAVKRITEETLQAIMKRPAAFPRVVATTSAKGDGIDVLRAEIAALLPEF